MNIEWTLCSERMPPDDSAQIIVRYTGQSLLPRKKRTLVVKSHETHDLFRQSVCAVKSKYEWTPFTKEKLEFLNDQ